MFDLILLTIVSFISAFTLTPVIIKLAIKLNVVDEPCQRKIHKSPIPTLGGLAIFSGFLIGLLVVQPDSPYHFLFYWAPCSRFFSVCSMIFIHYPPRANLYHKWSSQVLSSSEEI